MTNSSITIENKTSSNMEFHIEPECWPVILEVGKSVVISSKYDKESTTIQFSDNTDGGVFFAIYPGDGDLTATINGVDVTSIQ